MTPEQHLSNGDRMAWTKHDPEAALAEYRAALALSPAMTTAHWRIGQVHFFAEPPRLEEAADAFREAIRVAPNWSESHYWLGLVSFQQGQYDDAIAHHQRAIALSEKEDERLLISLGQCYFGAALFPQAVEAYRRGLLAARFDDVGYHLMLADALHAQGEADQACREWKKVLWLQSGREEDDPLAREAREKMGAHCEGGDNPSRPKEAPRGRRARRRAERRS